MTYNAAGWSATGIRRSPILFWTACTKTAGRTAKLDGTLAASAWPAVRTPETSSYGRGREVCTRSSGDAMGMNDIRKALPGIRFCGKGSVVMEFFATDKTHRDVAEASPREVFELIRKPIEAWLTSCEKRLKQQQGGQE